jgi:hypothetical protein
VAGDADTWYLLADDACGRVSDGVSCLAIVECPPDLWEQIAAQAGELRESGGLYIQGLALASGGHLLGLEERALRMLAGGLMLLAGSWLAGEQPVLPPDGRALASWFYLVVAGSADSIVMVEGGANEITEADTLDALKDRPEARNLVNIYAALAGHTAQQVIADYAGAQFGTFKPALADLAVAKLEPITLEMNRLMKDEAEIDRILGKGADRAEAIANPRPGDVWQRDDNDAGPSWRREVVHVFGDRTVVWRCNGVNSPCSTAYWRDWCSTATLIRRGDA